MVFDNNLVGGKILLVPKLDKRQKLDKPLFASNC